MRGEIPSVDVSNVLNEAKKQQVIALGRLGWSLRRIQNSTGVRRETAGVYLKGAGVAVAGLPVKQENCRRANFTISMTCMGFGANLSGFLSGQKQQKNLSKQELIRRSVRSPLWVC